MHAPADGRDRANTITSLIYRTTLSVPYWSLPEARMFCLGAKPRSLPPGTHRLELVVNGAFFPLSAFEVGLTSGRVAAAGSAHAELG